MSESRVTTVDRVNEIRALVSQAESCMLAMRKILAHVEQESNISAATLAKAAETDRLTDENRSLRRKVEDLEAMSESSGSDANHALWGRDDAGLWWRVTCHRGEPVSAYHPFHGRRCVYRDSFGFWHSEAGPPVGPPAPSTNHDLEGFTAEKCDPVEVFPGPDYVTRSELVDALRSEVGISAEGLARALESKKP